jgi:hypothetical protein
VEVDPTRMCELLIGLPAVIVLGIVDEGAGSPLRVHVEMRRQQGQGTPRVGGQVHVSLRVQMDV